MAKTVHGNHPFTEGPKDKPIHITRDKVGYFTFPEYDLSTSCWTHLYLASDKMTFGTWDLAPGSKYYPSNHHPGDETYFILEGELTSVNTNSGQTVRVRENEALLIPRGAPHYAYNFGTKTMKTVFVVAPQHFVGQHLPDDMGGKFRVLKGEQEDSYPVWPDMDEPQILGTINHLGRWPVDGEEARKDPKFLRLVTEEKKLHVVNGVDHFYLMKFAVSNDLMHVGELFLNAGGTGCSMTEPESHKGQCIIYVAKGTLSFMMVESREAFHIQKDEALFIPANTTYQMMNYKTEQVRAIFAIEAAL